jgi:hypothetical protein
MEQFADERPKRNNHRGPRKPLIWRGSTTKRRQGDDMKDATTTRTCGFFVELFEGRVTDEEARAAMQRASLNRIVARIGGNR